MDVIGSWKKVLANKPPECLKKRLPGYVDTKSRVLIGKVLPGLPDGEYSAADLYCKRCKFSAEVFIKVEDDKVVGLRVEGIGDCVRENRLERKG